MTTEKRRYWLMKSEPDTFSIDDLKRLGASGWDGVRNHRARNFMRDDMRLGDLVLFYHSSTKPPGVAGIARVCRESHPDPTQFDPKSQYFDEKATPDHPRWFMVAVEFVEKLPSFVPLQQIKDDPQLQDMWVRKRGMRLSIQPVEDRHFRRVVSLGGAPKPP